MPTSGALADSWGDTWDTVFPEGACRGSVGRHSRESGLLEMSPDPKHAQVEGPEVAILSPAWTQPALEPFLSEPGLLGKEG